MAIMGHKKTANWSHLSVAALGHTKFENENVIEKWNWNENENENKIEKENKIKIITKWKNKKNKK